MDAPSPALSSASFTWAPGGIPGIQRPDHVPTAPWLLPSYHQARSKTLKLGSPPPTTTWPYLMMSMWPFLAAKCKGLVPLGSVVSPGRGSSKAAHMLLLRSSWTTLMEGSK